jgi:hypothetical protein
MVLLRRTFIACLLGVGSAKGATGGDWHWPPLSGEISGKFVLPAQVAVPPWDWKLRVIPDGALRRKAELSVGAAGARLRIDAAVDLVGGEGTWNIREGEVDPAAWFAIIAPQVMSGASGIKVDGRVILSGGGTLVRGNHPHGTIKFVWSNGSVRDDAHGWRFEGVTLTGQLDGDFTNLAAARSERPWQLTVKTITTTRFGARNLAIDAQLNENGTVSLLSARVELAGGDVTIDPNTVSIFPPVLDFNLRVNRVGLQDLVGVVPASLADARGRIDGMVRLGWSKAAGIRVGAGHFALRDDEVATLRLAPTPGFLTHRFPEHLSVLPAWTGPLAKLMQPLNPVYGDARDIELGRTSLQIVSFDLKLTPKGDNHGRTVVVSVSARAIQPQAAVKLVSFEINVSGPLESLLQMKSASRFSLEMK